VDRSSCVEGTRGRVDAARGNGSRAKPFQRRRLRSVTDATSNEAHAQRFGQRIAHRCARHKPQQLSMSLRRNLDAPFDRTTSFSVAVDHNIDSCACGLNTDGAADGVYNEAAFHYFLDVERRRSAASNQPFVLLLVDMNNAPPTSAEFDPLSAQKLMSGLAECVRETDFVGWYLDRRIAGAVLTQHADPIGSDLQQAISRRVVDVLRACMRPHDVALRVCVYLYPSAVAIASEIC
jgi:hypothetical protein